MDSKNATNTSGKKPSHCEPLGDAQRIADIVDAASELTEIIERGEATFLSDHILQRAAERLLEIIGEAATTLSAETIEATPDVPWNDIRRLRIVLAHHYHRIDPTQVWTIATSDVPKLVVALRTVE